MPAFAHGVVSFLWALLFAFYIFLFGYSVGFSRALSFTAGVIAGAGIFLYVRTYGEDDPTRP